VERTRVVIIDQGQLAAPVDATVPNVENTKMCGCWPDPALPTSEGRVLPTALREPAVRSARPCAQLRHRRDRNRTSRCPLTVEEALHRAAEFLAAESASWGPPQ
jgi:hypothetical protein